MHFALKMNTLCKFNILLKPKQVDILISKNQALQILYLKHIAKAELHKLPWIETHKNLIPTKLNNDTVQFYCYITYNSKQRIPYNWPTGSQQVLSSICVI